MRENTLMLQRPSIQALFDGYNYYPYGEGQPIPAPIARPKDLIEKKANANNMSMSAQVSSRRQPSLEISTTTNQATTKAQERKYNGSVIRNDQSLIIENNQFASGPPLSQSQHHSRHGSLNASQHLNLKGLQVAAPKSLAPAKQTFSANPGESLPQQVVNQSVQLQSNYSTTRYQHGGDAQLPQESLASQSMVVDERQK